MRFSELERMFKENASFSTGSAAAKKLKAIFDSMNRIFPAKSEALRNRASIVSFCNVVSQVQASGQLKKIEKRLGEFFEKFSDELTTEVEKGQKATDRDLIEYQQAVNYGTADRESIEKRRDVLVKKLILFEPALAPCFLKDASVEKSLEVQIRELTDACSGLVYQRNDQHRSKKGEDLFKATNETTNGWKLIANPIKNQHAYGQFVDAAYKIFYEGSGSGARLGGTLPSVIEDIKTLRTDLRHDIEHGKQSKIKSKEKKITNTIHRYSGKLSISLLGNEDFLALHLGVLDGLKKYLETLKV